VARVFSPGLIASENTVFEQAAAEGISVFVASGDNGSEACERSSERLKELSVQDPASQPFVTAVGGTHLAALGPPPAESVWNDTRTQNGAGGGGISGVWRMPSWQAGPGVVNRYSTGKPCHMARGYCREVPDISASADPQRGYIIVYKGHWIGEGGTSAATPLCAALLADISSRRAPPARRGFLNPLLYSLPKGTFNDIRKGNNDFTRTHHGRYPATRWFDLASGLGSPIGPSLAAALWRHR
jgi:kumamolisin